MVKDREKLREEYQTSKTDALFHRTYHADAVHTCYPWISGTTFFNRVKAGRIPIKKKNVKGTGYATELDFPGLVHVGVDDEMITFGARGDTSRIEYKFVPLKEHHDNWETVKSKNDLDNLVQFYKMYEHHVSLTIDIRHEGLLDAPMLETRRKRSERVYFVIVHPSDLDDDIGTDPLSRSVLVFSVARIHVWRIREQVLERLIGISPLKREAFAKWGETTALK